MPTARQASATSMAYSRNTTGSLYVKATLAHPRSRAARASVCGLARSASVSISTRFAHVPVLAELAGEIAAGRAERQHGRAGQEVIERLFLDRIDAEPARAAVGEQPDLAAFGPANKAQAALSVVHLARTRAHIALHPTVG